MQHHQYNRDSNYNKSKLWLVICCTFKLQTSRHKDTATCEGYQPIRHGNFANSQSWRRCCCSINRCVWTGEFTKVWLVIGTSKHLRHIEIQQLLDWKGWNTYPSSMRLLYITTFLFFFQGEEKKLHGILKSLPQAYNRLFPKIRRHNQPFSVSIKTCVTNIRPHQ